MLRVAWSVERSWSVPLFVLLSEASGTKRGRLQRGASTRCRVDGGRHRDVGGGVGVGEHGGVEDGVDRLVIDATFGQRLHITLFAIVISW